MDVRNCPSCGRIFNRLRRDICPVCAKKEDEEYELVRDYIYDNPKADIITVSEATGVPEDTIIKFLREDRLVNASQSLILSCESCEKPIASGKFCESCAENLKKDITVVTSKKREDEEAKSASFHFMKDRLYKKR